MKAVILAGGLGTRISEETHLKPKPLRRRCRNYFPTSIPTSPFAGRPAIDEGPDAFLARLPWGTSLAKAVGLGDTLVSPASGSAAVWFDQLHPIPQGLLLGMPTDVMALSRSHLLTWGGKFRAALEPFLRRTSVDPDSLGGYVRARFGDQVHERLVDPLVGSIYAADTDHFSLAAVPQIFDLASRSRSVLIAGRRMPKPSAAAGPVFYAPQHGMGAMAAAVHAAVIAAGGSVHIDHTVAELSADGDGWRVDGEHFDLQKLAEHGEKGVEDDHQEDCLDDRGGGAQADFLGIALNLHSLVAT